MRSQSRLATFREGERALVDSRYAVPYARRAEALGYSYEARLGGLS
jgi:hypothetical protein